MWKQRCVYAVDAQRLFERRDDAACLLLALWRQREMMFLRWKRSSVWKTDTVLMTPMQELFQGRTADRI